MNLSNQKHFLTIVICFAITIILSNCSRKNEAPIEYPKIDVSLLDVIESYYKVADMKADGKFIFESNLCNNDPSLKNIVTAGGVFYDKQGNVVNNSGAVSIGGMQLNNHDGTFYIDKPASQNGLYGTNVTFSIKSNPLVQDLGTGTTSSGATTVSVYSPLPISITNVPANKPLTLTANTSTTLTWPADSKNPKGVVVMAEYIPSRSPNRNIAAAGATTLIENSELVADNGSTSVPWSFFSGYPAGGHIILWVARGAYTVASDSTYNYIVGGYTAAAVWDVVVPATPPTITASNYVSVSGFTVTYTNTATLVKTYFTIPTGGGKLGTLPAGTYNINFSKPSNTTKYAFASCDGSSVTGTSATFNNVVVNSNCAISISDPNRQP
jgi:hypothetical protein